MFDRPKIVDYRNNGARPQPTFSASEMKRRQDGIRTLMAEHRMDAALFTSYHNICYLSDFLYCYFGRRYGLVIDHQKATSVTAAIDGGQPARRTFGDNVTYTDWEKTNYLSAVQGLTKGVKRLDPTNQAITVDLLKKFKPTHVVDIMVWDYKAAYPPGHFDIICSA